MLTQHTKRDVFAHIPSDEFLSVLAKVHNLLEALHLDVVFILRGRSPD